MEACVAPKQSADNDNGGSSGGDAPIALIAAIVVVAVAVVAGVVYYLRTRAGRDKTQPVEQAAAAATTIQAVHRGNQGRKEARAVARQELGKQAMAPGQANAVQAIATFPSHQGPVALPIAMPTAKQGATSLPVVMPTAVTAMPAAAPAVDAKSRLQKLNDLKAAGLLTDDEYNNQRGAIIASI